MARLVLVRPGSGSPDVLSLEAWQALTRAPVFAAPGDPLAERLREAGYDAEILEEAEPSRLRSETPGRDVAGVLGRNLLATHQHGEVSAGARALASRLADLAQERGEIAFIVSDEAVTRAVLERGMQGDVEIEFVIGRAPRGHRLLDLVVVMARLRGPGGCPWDAEQTHQTLAKHLLDETYELLEAIEAGTDQDIAEELGDLLLQVVFHAQMGTDAGTFDVDDVATTLIEKLVRRHPHVFGDVEVSGAREVVENWDVIKQHEKSRTSAVEGVTESLPALAYAQKLQRRAGSAGFDWSDVEGALSKVREEAEELARADAGGREDELGDLLFAIVALGRHLDLDAESALRRSARRFRDRFQKVEQAARERGVALGELDEGSLTALWDEVKSR
ncbi:MAG TPA: nucleoside triphosphate pyrophosphohydrolase [Actinomycetota bacterium]|nr:nucleoside triphosphate pyrophosphohydrolase [Actinomycetota bacterium]